MVYVIQVCWPLASRIRTDGTPFWSCSRAVWHIPLLCVQWKTADDGQRNCPKHVEFYSKNKFEKLVHLVGFIIRIYHDTRSDVCHCCVYSEKTPDDGQRNCPKHVEFCSKNKFQKLVHLVGFIIRIYHDARSPERRIQIKVQNINPIYILQHNLLS